MTPRHSGFSGQRAHLVARWRVPFSPAPHASFPRCNSCFIDYGGAPAATLPSVGGLRGLGVFSLLTVDDAAAAPLPPPTPPFPLSLWQRRRRRRNQQQLLPSLHASLAVVGNPLRWSLTTCFCIS